MERLTTRCAGHAIMAYAHEEKYTTQEWIDMLTERLAAYEDAEQDGRLVVLPCKVGDTVYVTYGEGYRPHVVDRIHILANCNVQVRMRHFCKETLYLSASEFGKTAFLAREEAEAALKGGAE